MDGNRLGCLLILIMIVGIAVMAVVEEINPRSREPEDPIVYLGDPSIPECSIRARASVIDELVEMGFDIWAEHCEEELTK